MTLILQPASPTQANLHGKSSPFASKAKPNQLMQQTAAKDWFKKAPVRQTKVRTGRGYLSVQNRATIRDIMEIGEHRKFLHKPGTEHYFVVDPQYTRLVTREEMATRDTNAGKETKRDGFGQVTVTTSFPKDENGKFFVRLQGPVINDPEDDRLNYHPIPESPGMLEKLWLGWKALVQKNPHLELPLLKHFIADKQTTMTIVAEFENLSPDGYTDSLNAYSRDEMKEILDRKQAKRPEWPPKANKPDHPRPFLDKDRLSEDRKAWHP